MENLKGLTSTDGFDEEVCCEYLFALKTGFERMALSHMTIMTTVLLKMVIIAIIWTSRNVQK